MHKLISYSKILKKKNFYNNTCRSRMVLDPDREVCKASFPLLCVCLWCRAWNKLSDTSGDPLIMTLGSRFIPGRSSCPTSRRQTGFVCPHLGWTSHSREPSCWWSGRCTDLKEDRDVFQITMSSGTSDDRLKHPIICETAHVFAAPPAGGAETETRQMWKLNRFELDMLNSSLNIHLGSCWCVFVLNSHRSLNPRVWDICRRRRWGTVCPCCWSRRHALLYCDLQRHKTSMRPIIQRYIYMTYNILKLLGQWQ